LSEPEILAFLIGHARSLGIEPERDPNVMPRLVQAAAKAAAELAHAARTEVNLPFLFANESGPLHLQVAIPPDGGHGPRLDPRVKLT